MSLEERIRLIRDAEERQKDERKKAELEEQEREKKNSEESNRRWAVLNPEADQLLLPILREANRVIADNKGTLDDSRTYVSTIRNLLEKYDALKFYTGDSYRARRYLIWDDERSSGRHDTMYSAKFIALTLDEEGNVGVNFTKEITHINQESWKNKVEDEIVRLVETKKYCFRTYVPDGM